MSGLTYAERTALRLLIDQRRRALAFEADADSFVRTTVRGRRGVSYETLLRLRGRAEGVTDEAVARAVARLGVTPDKKGILRFPEETLRAA